MPFRAGLILCATLAATSSAHAVGTVPDAATLEKLRQSTGGHGVRVIGTFGQKEIARPIVDSTGVSSADWSAATAARPAIFATPDARHAAVPAPLPWSEIEEIKTNQQHKLQGAVVGGVVGLMAALALVGSGNAENEGAAGAVVGAPVLGALAGTFIGSLVGSKTIYRAQENP